LIIQLLSKDPFRMKVLEYVNRLNLPDCWVAAGFIRNMVWDALHDRPRSILNDIDVIYYDPTEVDDSLGNVAIERLNSMDPSANWEVKNQAFMHLRNGDRPYQSSEHAMSFWPEKETAVGARMNANGSLVVSAPFGTSSLFAGLISHNPKRDIEIFNHRVQSKGWLSKWPHLRIFTQQDGCT
jgi:uncharacterized protein